MKRIPRFKPAKPRRRVPWRIALVISLGLGIAAELGYSVFFSPLFQVKSIRIDGDAALPKVDIQARLDSIVGQKFLGFLPKRNFLFFESNDIASTIHASFFGVGRVTVNKDWRSHMVIVAVAPRKEVAVWCQTTAPFCSYIDETAFIFAPAPQGSGGILAVINDARSINFALGKQVVEPATLADILKIRALLIAAGYMVDLVTLRPSRDVAVRLNGSFGVIFTLDESPAVQVERLKNLIDLKLKDDLEKVDYIDLRIGNRIFYKLKDVVQ